MGQIKKKENKFYYENEIFKNEEYKVKLVIEFYINLKNKKDKIKYSKIWLVVDGKKESNFFNDIENNKFFNEIVNKIINTLNKAKEQIFYFLDNELWIKKK